MRHYCIYLFSPSTENLKLSNLPNLLPWIIYFFITIKAILHHHRLGFFKIVLHHIQSLTFALLISKKAGVLLKTELHPIIMCTTAFESAQVKRDRWVSSGKRLESRTPTALWHESASASATAVCRYTMRTGFTEAGSVKRPQNRLLTRWRACITHHDEKLSQGRQRTSWPPSTRARPASLPESRAVPNTVPAVSGCNEQ